MSVLCCLQLRAENNALKRELEREFINKTVVSKIILGEKAIPPGYQTLYPVNTLVYPDRDDVTFRVEWLEIRTEVGPQMQNRFEGGSSFRITAIDFKDDRLELKLQSLNGRSAKLKLMLGAGWQSKFDVAAVQIQLARIFVLAEQPQPTPATAAFAGSTPAPVSVSVVSTNEYRSPSNAPVIPGRISNEQLQAVLTAADAESQQSFSDLLKQAGSVSNALLSIQRQTSRFPNFAAHPRIREISNLQGRLGKSLQPRQIEDIVELNELLRQCVQIFYNFAPADSNDIYTSIREAIDAQRVRQEQVSRAKNSVIEVERTLDDGNLSRASQLYPQLSSDPQMVQVSSLQQYLQYTTGLREDLATYAQANQIDRRHDIAAVQQVLNLAHEIDLLNISQARPVTKTFLQNVVESDKAAVKQRLDMIPAFHIDLAAYKSSEKAIERSGNAEARVSFLSTKSQDLDKYIASAADLSSLLQRADTLLTIEQVFGESEKTSLIAKGADLPAAEELLANLVERLRVEQESLREAQARLDAERAKQQRQLEARQELPRQVMHDALMVAMLDDKYAQTTIVGYRLESSKKREALKQEVSQYRPLSPQFWRDVDAEFNRLLPGMTESQASDTLSVLRWLRSDSSK